MTLISVKLEVVDPNSVRPSVLTQQHSQHQHQTQQPQPQQPQTQQLQAQLPLPQHPRPQQPQTQQSQTQHPQTQQPQNQLPHMSNLNPMHPSGVRATAPVQSLHTIIKTEPRQHIISNNSNVTSQPPQQLKPNTSYTPVPSHTNTNTTAAARAAANITIPQHHPHLQHHHNQHQQQPHPPIMNNTSSPNTIIKPSKKRITKRGAIAPTVTMATTNNPTNNSAAVSGTGTNSTTTSTGGENTGRWTAEEHRLFLQGLEQHGKGWKKIASLIKSRTVVQIRTHAQKYFQKLAKARQNGEEGEVSMEGRGNGPGGVGGMGMGQMGGGVCGGMGNGVGVGNLGVGCHGMSGYHVSKRRRQTTGTKRKSISSVVASMNRREAKRLTPDEQQPQHHTGGITGVIMNKALPAIAPVLSPFVYQHDGTVTTTPPPGLSTEGVLDINGHVTLPSITTAHHGTISGSALEDSL